MCTFTTNIDAASCDFLTAYFVIQVDECRRRYRNKESEQDEVGVRGEEREKERVRGGMERRWERRRKREREPERDRDGER